MRPLDGRCTQLSSSQECDDCAHCAGSPTLTSRPIHPENRYTPTARNIHSRVLCSCAVRTSCIRKSAANARRERFKRLIAIHCAATRPRSLERTYVNKHRMIFTLKPTDNVCRYEYKLSGLMTLPTVNVLSIRITEFVTQRVLHRNMFNVVLISQSSHSDSSI